MKICWITFFTLSHLIAYSQIKGSTIRAEDHVTFTEPVQSIYIGLYADVVVDCGADSAYLYIETEDNLLNHIERSLQNGVLRIDQKDWIQPSLEIVIRIGAPELHSIEQSTHDEVLVKSINTSTFEAKADVGTIILQGRSDLLKARSAVGTVDARELKSEQVDVEISSWGRVDLSDPKRITGNIQKSGKVTYSGTPKEISVAASENARIENSADESRTEKFATRYISFKIKNNSWKRLNAYVVGPKPDGRYFSYGFPMRPGQSRQETWTIGTKIYRQTALGTKKLLVEITSDDEDQTVKLYPGK